jgi:hypothetical protein
MDREADAIFRAEAAHEGYLKADPHPPGDGRGIVAWYRDHSMIHPGDTRAVGIEAPLEWFLELEACRE